MIRCVALIETVTGRTVVICDAQNGPAHNRLFTDLTQKIEPDAKLLARAISMLMA